MPPSNILQIAHKIIIHATASPTTDPNAPAGARIAIAALDDLLAVVDAVGDPVALVLVLILRVDAVTAVGMVEPAAEAEDSAAWHNWTAAASVSVDNTSSVTVCIVGNMQSRRKPRTGLVCRIACSLNAGGD